VVAEARRLDDNIGQQVAVARRGDQQVQDVVAARGRGVSLCLSVCTLANLETTRPNFITFCTRVKLWPWLAPL